MTGSSSSAMPRRILITQRFTVKNRNRNMILALEATSSVGSKLVTTNTATRAAMIASAYLEPLANNPLGEANAVFLESREFSELKRRVTRAAKHGEIPRSTPLEQIDAALAAGILSQDEASGLREHMEKVRPKAKGKHPVW